VSPHYSRTLRFLRHRILLIIPRLPRRAPELSAGIARQGCGKDSARCRRAMDGPSGNPHRKRGAQESSGNRVSFLLDTFLWTSKEKYLGRGSENPHSNKPRGAKPFLKSPSLCKPRMVYKLNRGHGLQILPLSMPLAGGTDLEGSLIENA
jgi:hypothetical protein